MKSKLLLSLFLVVSLFLTACGDTEKSSNNTADTLTVYTTVYPLQFLAEEIGGDYVDASTHLEQTSIRMSHLKKILLR